MVKLRNLMLFSSWIELSVRNALTTDSDFSALRTPKTQHWTNKLQNYEFVEHASDEIKAFFYRQFENNFTGESTQGFSQDEVSRAKDHERLIYEEKRPRAQTYTII